MLGNIFTERNVMRAGRGYNNMDCMDKSFYFHSIF